MITIQFTETEADGEEFPQEWTYPNDMKLAGAWDTFDVLVQMVMRNGNKRRRCSVEISMWHDDELVASFWRGPQEPRSPTGTTSPN